MCKKICLGGLVGSIVLFVWGALAWTVLPLHSSTMKTLPNEDAVLASLRANAIEPGFYGFPCPRQESGLTKEQQEAATKAFTEKFHEGPHGIVVLGANGGDPMPPSALLGSFLTQLVSALVAAWLLSKALGGLESYGARVQFVTVLGFLAAVVTHLPYWNWFSFPTDYTIAQLADLTIGWFLAGLVIAAIVKPAPAAS